MTYVDPYSKEEPIVRFGFIIENTKEMSDRLKGDEIEEYNMGLNAMSDRDRHVFSMFQFMIGNTDWKTNMMHNIKIVILQASLTLPTLDRIQITNKPR